MTSFTWAQMGVLALFMLASFLTGWLWRDYDDHDEIEHRTRVRRINRYRDEVSR